MRLFQNSGLSRTYKKQIISLVGNETGFQAQRRIFFDDRYCASHILLPCSSNDSDAFFTNGNDENLQRAWARENGLPAKTSLVEILLAQIEHHRADVFYNNDPVVFDGSFARRLPGSVKRCIAWRAAPGKIDFGGYDLVVSNFPSIRKKYEEAGIRTAELFPAHDPELDSYAENRERDIDVLFFGTYTRHHERRRMILEKIAESSSQFTVALHLDNSRFTRLAETPIGWFKPFSAVRRPKAVRAIAQNPVFGRNMYRALGRAKIVINASIDMAGQDRGNMRCFEAMGAGALLLTDLGNYPSGMKANTTMVNYDAVTDIVPAIRKILDEGSWQSVGAAGHEAIKTIYSKKVQYKKFRALL
jgi:hypothetical protein